MPEENSIEARIQHVCRNIGRVRQLRGYLSRMLWGLEKMVMQQGDIDIFVR